MPTTLVQRVLEQVSATDARYTALYRSDVSVHPIPYFGRLTEAEVLTLGLNPSSKEFTKSRKWPSQISAAAVAARLNDYFDATDPPPHRWFSEWSTALRALGASYDGTLTRRAAHIDLSPRATRGASAFNREPLRSVFLDMLRCDASVLIDVLETASKAKCVLAAGSATGLYYINEFIDREVEGIVVAGSWRRGAGPGQTAMLMLTLPSGRRLPTFFCSTGPTSPRVLSTAVAKNRGQLKTWLE